MVKGNKAPKKSTALKYHGIGSAQQTTAAATAIHLRMSESTCG
jgi:hypothetical protein